MMISRLSKDTLLAIILRMRVVRSDDNVESSRLDVTYRHAVEGLSDEGQYLP